MRISDPTNFQAIDQIKFQTQMLVEPVVVEHDKLIAFTDKLGQTAEAALNEFATDDLNLEFEDADAAAVAEANTDIDDAPIVRFLQKVLMGRHQRWRLRHSLRAVRKVLPDPVSH